MAEGVHKLLDGGFIQECQDHEWTSNVVLVKKPNWTWWMCIDFMDLNKVYPKNDYSLLKIDKLVDSTVGYLISFMDAFFDYYQIPIYPDSQEMTAFIVDNGLCCYKVMSFGLQNTKAT